MSFRGHIRKINEIEYLDSTVGENFENYEFLEEIRRFEEDTETNLVSYVSDEVDEMEIVYDNFIEAYENTDEYLISDTIKSIYEQAKDLETCKKHNIIRIDWF